MGVQVAPEPAGRRRRKGVGRRASVGHRPGGLQPWWWGRRFAQRLHVELGEARRGAEHHVGVDLDRPGPGRKAPGQVAGCRPAVRDEHAVGTLAAVPVPGAAKAVRPVQAEAQHVAHAVGHQRLEVEREREGARTLGYLQRVLQVALRVRRTELEADGGGHGRLLPGVRLTGLRAWTILQPYNKSCVRQRLDRTVSMACWCAERGWRMRSERKVYRSPGGVPGRGPPATVTLP